MNDRNLPAKPLRSRTLRRILPISSFRQYQHGVVLIVALVLLVVISLLAVSSMRNAGSAEKVAGNVRTTELATQSAEIALRYCENLVLTINKNAYNEKYNPGDLTFLEETDPPNLKPEDISLVTDLAKWKSRLMWDSNSIAVFTIPKNKVNQASITTAYKRFPECMVERLSVATSTSDFYIVTARGFGPEVAELVITVPPTRIRPVGTEVWLQSHIEIGPKLVP